jgi:hypothetical protein
MTPAKTNETTGVLRPEVAMKYVRPTASRLKRNAAICTEAPGKKARDRAAPKAAPEDRPRM